ncbi:MAG: TIGR00282 family metallophosphoesterase [Proteobacteria bacterium]|nr:TIGR00282 family metallophosphoesterase [Pseudomonadota bacterium]
MRLLMFGDVVGRSGRDALAQALPGLRERLDPDFIIVNGENAAHGFGITPKICDDLFEMGVDVVTTGNHAWDRREIVPYIEREPRLLRPLNHPAGTPGNGAGIFKARGDRRVLVIHPMGKLFMPPVEDPFAAVEAALKNHRLGQTVNCIAIDVHAETTSEKTALAVMVDGRASVVVGTHSHVPTADGRILPGGTAFQCDLGMCGDYDSVIGMAKEAALARFQSSNGPRLEPASGIATVCGVWVETDDATGLARRFEPVRLGGCLVPCEPLRDR